MLFAVSACLLSLAVSSVAGYGTKGHFNDAPIFPMVPAQPQVIYQEIPAMFPGYQNEAPFFPAPPMWPYMHMQPALFFHPPGCDTNQPYHTHFPGSRSMDPMNQNQWTQTPFQGQGQWMQPTFQNQGKGHWKQTPFQKQGQNQWKQPMSWNTKQNVNMIGQWDGFPVNDRMLSQPAISSLAPKRTEFKVPLGQSRTGPQTFNSFGVPVQSRRLR